MPSARGYAALRMQQSVKKYAEGVRRSHGHAGGRPRPRAVPIDAGKHTITATWTKSGVPSQDLDPARGEVPMTRSRWLATALLLSACATVSPTERVIHDELRIGESLGGAAPITRMHGVLKLEVITPDSQVHQRVAPKRLAQSRRGVPRQRLARAGAALRRPLPRPRHEHGRLRREPDPLSGGADQPVDLEETSLVTRMFETRPTSMLLTNNQDDDRT
jgi:hypothetical protein